MYDDLLKYHHGGAAAHSRYIHYHHAAAAIAALFGSMMNWPRYIAGQISPLARNGRRWSWLAAHANYCYQSISDDGEFMPSALTIGSNAAHGFSIEARFIAGAVSCEQDNRPSACREARPADCFRAPYWPSIIAPAIHPASADA